MLPIVLVLLVATSALAAPGVNLEFRSINDVALPEDNGRLVSALSTDLASEIIDAGELSSYELLAQQALNGIANQPDKKSQALALAQSIGLLGSLATGIPGDACRAAEAINTYVDAVRSGNFANVRSAIFNFIDSLSLSIDLIVQRANNPGSLRHVVGPRGNCNGGGRSYQFEAAWDLILSNANPNAANYVNEQYCAAKRLFTGFYANINNSGAFITAASLPPVNKVFLKAFEPVATFLASIPSGNSAAYAGPAKQAIVRAAANL